MTPEYGVSLVPWLHYILRFLTETIAAYGFAMLFNSPHRVCATAAVIGAVINTARIALHLELGVPAPAAVGLARARYFSSPSSWRAGRASRA